METVAAKVAGTPVLLVTWMFCDWLAARSGRFGMGS